jgi:hypothetical protein
MQQTLTNDEYELICNHPRFAKRYTSVVEWQNAVVTKELAQYLWEVARRLHVAGSFEIVLDQATRLKEEDTKTSFWIKCQKFFHHGYLGYYLFEKHNYHAMMNSAYTRKFVKRLKRCSSITYNESIYRSGKRDRSPVRRKCRGISEEFLLSKAQSCIKGLGYTDFPLDTTSESLQLEIRSHFSALAALEFDTCNVDNPTKMLAQLFLLVNYKSVDCCTISRVNDNTVRMKRGSQWIEIKPWSLKIDDKQQFEIENSNFGSHLWFVEMKMWIHSMMACK